MTQQQPDVRVSIVECVTIHREDFQLVGVYSRPKDANAAVEALQKVPETLVAVAQHNIPMSQVIELLLKDRLGQLHEVLVRLEHRLG